MMSPHYDHFFPNRPVDASHPDVVLDFNRCILCSLCVRASRDVDGKNVFALSGRGIRTHLIVNAKSGRLADTDFTLADKAAHVCPVGVILKKREGFAVPIGERRYDKAADRRQVDATRRRRAEMTATAQESSRSRRPRWPAASAATCRCSTSTSACSNCSNWSSSTARR